MTQTLTRAALLVALFVPSAIATRSARAAEQQPRECRWTAKLLVIDGVADESAWKDAATIDGFSFPWIAQGATARRAVTKTRLLWDREYLYWFAEMADSDLVGATTKVNGKDSDAFSATDTVSLFLKPADDKTGYYQFDCSVAGATRAFFIAKRPDAGPPHESPDSAIHITSKVVLHGTLDRHDDADQSWAIEGRITWRDLLHTGGRPQPGENWRFLVARQDQGANGAAELSTSAPLRPTDAALHRFEDYGALRFVGPSSIVAARHLGLADYRPVASSRVIGSPDPLPLYRAVRALPKLRLNFPIAVASQPHDGRLLIIDQKADSNSRLLRAAHRDGSSDDSSKDGSKEIEVLLDLKDIAYGITFHPQFASNGYLYVGSNGAAPGGKRTRITRYTLSRDAAAKLDPASALVIIDWPSDGHNGGDMAFGKDGMLYVTSGDGTSDSDANIVGQDLTRLTAKVLRIDVDHPAADKPYSIPSDNPFIGVKVGDVATRGETWAHGLRNPWRITVDQQTGAVWVGNNGQDLWEQAYRIERGANYGWSAMEGSHVFYADRRAPDAKFTLPTVEHSHAEARSLTGGVVYYGSRFPELRGAYIYGDYSTGKIWAVLHDGKQIVWHKEIADTTLAISGFGVDAHGELLICDHRGGNDGGLYRLEITPPDKTSPAAFPKRLSDTGLFAEVSKLQPAPGAIPYSVNSPLWSDGALKVRFLVLPPSSDNPAQAQPIDFTPRGSWTFPDHTVLVKSFALPQSNTSGSKSENAPPTRRWIETRLFTRQEGEWVGYSYRWNDEQTDATLVASAGADGAFTLDTGKPFAWRFPSRAECMVCHSRAANFVLGLSTEQLNRDHDYQSGKSNQLDLFEQLGVLRVDWRADALDQLRKDFTDAGLVGDKLEAALAKHTDSRNQREAVRSPLLAREPAQYARLADPADAGVPLAARARSYLHANCAQCHVPAGGGNAQMNLLYSVGAKERNINDIKPLHHTLGVANPRLVAPGSAARSVLLARMARRGEGQMPPLASRVVDEQGVDLIRRWIEEGARE